MLRRSLVAILPLVLALSSCSDEVPAGGTSRNPATTPPGAEDPQGDGAASRDEGTSGAKRDICTTLDYGHTRSNEDYYLQFDSDAAATDYSKGFLVANDIHDPAAITHDAKTLKLVGRVYDGIRKVFPKETSGLESPPRVFAVQADGINAFAGFDERKEYDKAPWIFWVHQATIDSGKPDAELEALYAHELGHLILRNMLPETRAKIQTHYRVAAGKEKGILGEVTPDDPNVKTHSEELRSLGDLVGREAAFGVLPISAYEDSEYQSMLATLADDRPQNADPQACQAADAGVAQARAFYKQNVSVNDLTLSLTPDQQNQLANLAATTSDSLKKCNAGVKKSIFELKIADRNVVVTANGQPVPLETILDPTTKAHELVYETLMTNDVERDVDANAGADTPTIDRMLQVVEKLHQRIATLDADASLPLDELRIYDLEEDADDAAVRVLRVLGDDPRGAANLFFAQLPDASACKSDIADGTSPRYGRFIDPHNATCWRAFHTLDLADALGKCPLTPPPSSDASASSASRSRTAAIADDGSLRLTQRLRLRLRR